ncbi:MAG: pyridoxamine 5'-phosphate oxidase family protein [Firmicutes bacterium]|nr:pyridoxamine 5'-phosphate oxidase family protein [Bacillota bacterium]
MFRELVRFKQALSPEDCIEVLKSEKRGVLSVNGDGGYPYCMPLNHYYDEESGKIYFHGGAEGHKIDAIRADDKVCFCVYDQGAHVGENWWLTVKSVIVFGRARLIDDKQLTEEISRKLCLKFTSDQEYIDKEVEKSLWRTLLFELEPEHISGKLVNER